MLLDSRIRGNDIETAVLSVRPVKMGIQKSMRKQPCVYILASQRNGTLYIGVTSDIVKRGWEHRNNVAAGFTKKSPAWTRHCAWFRWLATFL